jgi:hypothetical protein
MDLGLKDKVALVTRAGSQTGYDKGVAITPSKEVIGSGILVSISGTQSC